MSGLGSYSAIMVVALSDLTVASRQRQSPYPLVPLREALNLVLAQTPAPDAIATLSVDNSLVGHVLAEDVLADSPIPSGPSTNVDGYAVRCECAGESSRAPFTVILNAGRTLTATDEPGIYEVMTSFPTEPLPAGSIYRINTGAPLPPGMDAVIMVEDTELVSEDGDEKQVRLLAQVDAGENVRQAGSDVRPGEKVLEARDVVTAIGGEIGTLAFIKRRSVRFVPGAIARKQGCPMCRLFRGVALFA